MSQFDKYTKSEYVECLRRFLALKKATYKRDAGFMADESKSGRGARYPEEAIRTLETMANEKAARAERSDLTLGDRYQIARDYRGLSDARVAREMGGVSRELARRWGANLNRPTCLPQLAELFKVPVLWLERGGEEFLPANSHIGVRVGADAMACRERLYDMTTAALADLPEDADDTTARAFIEKAVFERPWLAKAARQAGGRWQVLDGMLMFSPWQPIPEHGLTRRLWPDEVEQIIDELLVNCSSVYRAWRLLKEQCERKGLPYPKLITLQKRVQQAQKRVTQFGADLNRVITDSMKPTPG